MKGRKYSKTKLVVLLSHMEAISLQVLKAIGYPYYYEIMQMKFLLVPEELCQK